MEVKEIVKEKYGEAARRVIQGEGLPADCFSNFVLRWLGCGLVRPHHLEPVRRGAGGADTGGGLKGFARLRQSNRTGKAQRR